MVFALGNVLLFDLSGAFLQEGPLADHGRFVLLLRSAICHLGGESVNKGHYVAYAADRYRNSGRGDRGRPTSAG